MQRTHWIGAGLALLSLISTPALAEEPTVAAQAPAPETAQPSNHQIHARYRAWAESLDIGNFDGGDSGQQNAVYQNLRADAALRFGALGLKLELDAFTGRLAGDGPQPLPETFQSSGTRADERDAFGEPRDFVDPRNAYVEYQSLVLLRAGLQTSRFGLGLVAHDGVEDDRQLFNHAVGGDRSLRLLLGTRPFAIAGANRKLSSINVGIGGDFVFRDDNASFIDGDRARQFISSVYYQDANPQNREDSKFLGAYFAYRDQTDHDGDNLRVAAFDISARRTWNDSEGRWFFSVAGESALLTGSTTRSYPQIGGDKTGILGLGAATEFEVRHKDLDLTGRLKAGYASGDANSDDEKLYRFRFDPNYKVGLILFDHYIPAVTRTGYVRASDPERSGLPPKGVDGLISDGAVENAVYLNPMMLFGRPDALLAGVGLVWARSATPLADPYNTFANGGDPVGPRGAKASRDLGIEVDVAAQYRIKLVSNLHLEAKAEYGILFPGKAFDDILGNSAAPQNLLRGRLALLW